MNNMTESFRKKKREDNIRPSAANYSEKPASFLKSVFPSIVRTVRLMHEFPLYAPPPTSKKNHYC